jgi:hypothetical protein
MWTYRQKTGELLDAQGRLLAAGYSGHGEGKNNPELQEHRGIGPIPRGTYVIHAPIDTESHGPFVLRLDPLPENEMFGRSGFLMHGDSKIAPGTASLGCIIMPRAIREEVWASGDRSLQVIL